LARNREIDRSRATRAQAQIDVAMAEPAIERSRLDYMRSAARAYWAWIGSGERYGAGERLVDLALERDKQIELKVQGGVIANIDRIDNQQNIALRNGIVIQADRAVQQAAIDLSLYHRDPSGKPPNGLDRQVLQASLIFQMPAQRRDARGKLQTLDSQLMQLDRQLAYAHDQVQAEVQDAFSMLERAYEFHKQAFKREELATLVASAEREQLRLGRSDILRVTLREQAKFEADVLEITARQEFWRAESDLRAADTSLGPESPGLLREMMPPVVPEVR
jgi:outer membrane protein TolC